MEMPSFMKLENKLQFRQVMKTYGGCPFRLRLEICRRRGKNLVSDSLFHNSLLVPTSDSHTGNEGRRRNPKDTVLECEKQESRTEDQAK